MTHSQTPLHDLDHALLTMWHGGPGSIPAGVRTGELVGRLATPDLDRALLVLARLIGVVGAVRDERS